MPEELSYTDHDLLILLNERVKQQTDTVNKLKDALDLEISDLKLRVTALERTIDRQSGFFSGAKFVWGIIGALPPSLILLLKDVNL